MRRGQKKTHIRINGKKFALSICVLLLAVCAGIFLIRGIRVNTEKRAERILEEQRIEEQKKAEEEQKKAEEQRKAEEEAVKEASFKYALESGFLVLLNKEHSVDENYVAEDLVSIDESYCYADRPSSTHLLRKEAAEAFRKMMDAAKQDGYTIKMTTAYRSYNYQNSLYTNYVSKYGQAEADRFSARPGTSEHQSGLASDLSASSVNGQLTSKFGDTDEGKWIAAHCAEYGFILRYPEEDSEARTGYVYEPWHVRYVTVPVAEEIMGEGLVLEEYLAKHGVNN